MTSVAYTGFRFRSTRGRTPNRLQALSMRGMGGVRLSIGGGRFALMRAEDEALPVEERARLVGVRRDVKIVTARMWDDGILRVDRDDAAQAESDIAISMTDLWLRGFRCMSEPVTVGLFKQLMPAGYPQVMQRYEREEADDGRQALQALLGDPSRAGDAINWVSYADAATFASRLKEETGRNFRLPTQEEGFDITKHVVLEEDVVLWTSTPSDDKDYEFACDRPAEIPTSAVTSGGYLPTDTRRANLSFVLVEDLVF